MMNHGEAGESIIYLRRPPRRRLRLIEGGGLLMFIAALVTYAVAALTGPAMPLMAEGQAMAPPTHTAAAAPGELAFGLRISVIESAPSTTPAVLPQPASVPADARRRNQLHAP